MKRKRRKTKISSKRKKPLTRRERLLKKERQIWAELERLEKRKAGSDYLFDQTRRPPIHDFVPIYEGEEP